MVLIDLYGKIQPMIISRKLSVGISNLQPDWVEGLKDDFEEEILIHKNNLIRYKEFIDNLDGTGIDPSYMANRYNLENIVAQLNWDEKGKSPMCNIAEHLIEIQVFDFQSSILQVKNGHIDSPTCEPQYPRKFLFFCNKVQLSQTARRFIPNPIPCSSYDSDDFGRKPLILSFLERKVRMCMENEFSITDYTERGIESLKYMGELIDNFLVSEKDFWLFDYIVNAIYNDDSQDAYHVFKVMSLIEMLIINPKNRGKTNIEIERKLPQFLSSAIPVEERASFSTIARKLRNKIGHGDFTATQKLLEQYRQTFMQNFWYDEFEYSIENWTYGNISLFLDEALNEILWMMLHDRDRLTSLQMS